MSSSVESHSRPNFRDRIEEVLLKIGAGFDKYDNIGRRNEAMELAASIHLKTVIVCDHYHGYSNESILYDLKVSSNDRFARNKTFYIELDYFGNERIRPEDVPRLLAGETIPIGVSWNQIIGRTMSHDKKNPMAGMTAQLKSSDQAQGKLDT